MDPQNPYLSYIKSFASVFEKGKDLPLGAITTPPPKQTNQSAPKVVILSPHPDDECVMGALALRLMRETGSAVFNVPITFGSNTLRKEERKKELSQACKWLGFKLETMACGGLDQITPDSRSANPEHWKIAVSELAEVIQKIKPDILFLPNSTDWNRTHLGVNLLTYDALGEISQISVTLVETEFWGQIREPNLLVESSDEEVADLVAALSHHAGEVRRNPFHLRLPSWMQDNVRRGAEVVGGQGSDAPDFNFATLYRVTKWIEGKQFLPWKGGKIIPRAENVESDILNHLK